MSSISALRITQVDIYKVYTQKQTPNPPVESRGQLKRGDRAWDLRKI